MQAQFWHNAWEKGKTGWKQRSVNSRLQQYWSQLEVPSDSTVLVPLCGDSLDMLWLVEQGYRVLGSELSEAAVKGFFTEHFDAQSYSVSRDNITGHVIYQADRIAVYCGDFFSLTAAQPGCVDAAYDRAATVAMPPELRSLYAQKMHELLAPGGSVMLIAWEYDQQKMDGPPFSVPRAEVDHLYAQGFEIDTLTSHSGPEFLGNLAERGLDTLTESVYRLRRH